VQFFRFFRKSTIFLKPRDFSDFFDFSGRVGLTIFKMKKAPGQARFSALKFNFEDKMTQGLTILTFGLVYRAVSLAK